MVASAARERLGTCSSADCLQDFLSCLDYPVWRALAFSDKLAFDYFEITLVVVATTATGNRAHVYVCATEWNHLQVLVPVAGRRCHGGVLPTTLYGRFADRVKSAFSLCRAAAFLSRVRSS